MHNFMKYERPSTSSYIELNEKHVSPSDIRPYPKDQPRQQTSKGRIRSKSAVLTATPVKQSIEQEAAARKAKQQKTKRKPVAIEPLTEEPESLSDIESPNKTESECGHEEVDVIAFVVVRYVRENRHLCYVACVENVNEDTMISLSPRGMETGSYFLMTRIVTVWTDQTLIGYYRYQEA